MSRVNYKNGKLTARTLYFLEGIVLLIRWIASNEIRMNELVAFFAVWLFSFAILMVINEEDTIAEGAFCIYILLCSCLLMVLDVYRFRSMLVVLLVYSVQWMAILLFLRKLLCVFLACAQAFFLLLFHFWDTIEIENMLSLSEYLICMVTILMMCWMATNLISFIEIQNKKSIEQERSLDDMLYVVESMCNEATKAAKTKAAFLSNMSHEIRTPINSVLGMNEMIARESSEKHILEYSGAIASSGHMLLSIVNDILDFSKIESGKMEILAVEYELSAVINDILHIIQGRLENKSLEFELIVDENLPSVMMGDEVRIKQIVTNLLTNAVKYTDKGKVTLKISADYTYENYPFSLRIDVIDTGKGIKEEDKDLLFSAFTRVDEKVNRSIEGTGLGLAITSNFVSMMDGKIGVESEYGKGSDFFVIIPQKIVSDEKIGAIQERLQNLGAKEVVKKRVFTAPNARVLLVDDNMMNIKVEKLLLKQTKMHVTTVTSGAEALDVLSKESFDIILLDHMMPIMDGMETLTHIKERHLANNTPVIALTANAIRGAKEMYLEHGFQDYLTKPIVIDELERLFERTLPKELVIWEENAPKEPDGTEEAQEKVVGESADVLIDAAIALKYAGNDMGMRQFMASVYIEEAEEMKKILLSTFLQQDWETYRVKVHALKGSSLGVGAVQLSELAKKIELALKEGDTSVALENHDQLMEIYEKVIQVLAQG